MDMATSLNPYITNCPPKQPLKTINRSPKFLRNGYNAKGNAAKRKSAVELLQESKAYYVKSEHVLDAKQELKHSEHLQVTSSYPSSYNTRLRNAQHRPLSSGSDGVSSCSQATSPPLHIQLTNQRADFLSNRDGGFAGIEQKMLTVTISSGNNGNGAGNSHKHKIVAGSKLNNVGSASLTRTHSSASKTNSNAMHETLANGKMPPRSPHLRSKTQPEVPLRQSHLHEYRRSHSEMEHSNDIQMKLRKLIYTDSKENLSSKPEIISNGQYNNHDQLDNAEPFIQPRHQQDLGNYCIHKSMPDLSRGKSQVIKEFTGKCGCDSSDSSSDESINLHAAKSVDLRPSSSWTTSDYASRSPSSRKELEVEGRTYLNNNYNYQNNGGGSSNENSEDFQETGTFGAMTSTSSPDGTGKKRTILRSKSDISHRYSKSGTDLSQTGSSPKKSSSKAGAELERFFDTFGLDSSALAMLQAYSSDSGSVVFFDSVSTESSSCLPAGLRHRGSDEEDERAEKEEQHASGDKRVIGGAGLTNKDLILHGPLETSIVERNARVIKWLYNCRKLGARRDSAE